MKYNAEKSCYSIHVLNDKSGCKSQWFWLSVEHQQLVAISAMDTFFVPHHLCCPLKTLSTDIAAMWLYSKVGASYVITQTARHFAFLSTVEQMWQTQAVLTSDCRIADSNTSWTTLLTPVWPPIFTLPAPAWHTVTCVLTEQH